MSFGLVRRSVKGSALSAADHDGNLDKIQSVVENAVGAVEPTPSPIRVADTPVWDYAKNASAPLSQRVPAIARTGSRSWATWYSNDSIAGEGPGDYINIAYSDDDWLTSNEYAHLSFESGADGNRVFDPKLWTDPEGKLWLLFGVTDAPPLIDAVQGSWASVCANPMTASPVWGRPFRLSYWGVPGFVQPAGQRHLLAIDYFSHNSPANADFAGKNIHELDWRNGRVKFVGRLLDSTAPTWDETCVVELRDGRLMAVYRTSSSSPATEMQFSEDGGATWGGRAKFTAIGANPAARVWLGRSPNSDRLVFVYNNSATDRTNMTLIMSDDEGVTWPHSVVLDVSANISYPDVSFKDDGQILIITDRERTTQREIRVHLVDESAIAAGTETVVTRVISNKAT